MRSIPAGYGNKDSTRNAGNVYVGNHGAGKKTSNPPMATVVTDEPSKTMKVYSFMVCHCRNGAASNFS